MTFVHPKKNHFIKNFAEFSRSQKQTAFSAFRAFSFSWLEKANTGPQKEKTDRQTDRQRERERMRKKYENFQGRSWSETIFHISCLEMLTRIEKGKILWNCGQMDLALVVCLRT